MLQYDAGQQGDPARAVEAFRTACHLGLDQGVGGVLHTAGVWSQWAAVRGAWREAAEACGYALTATERLFHTQLARQHKETWLREAIGLPARAAYALGRAGDLSGAVVALESGRAMLLSETLERDRADLNVSATLAGATLPSGIARRLTGSPSWSAAISASVTGARRDRTLSGSNTRPRR